MNNYPKLTGTALGEHLAIADATGTVRALDLAAGSGVWSTALDQQSPQAVVPAVDWPGSCRRRSISSIGTA